MKYIIRLGELFIAIFYSVLISQWLSSDLSPFGKYIIIIALLLIIVGFMIFSEIIIKALEE